MLDHRRVLLRVLCAEARFWFFLTLILGAGVTLRSYVVANHCERRSGCTLGGGVGSTLGGGAGLWVGGCAGGIGVWYFFTLYVLYLLCYDSLTCWLCYRWRSCCLIENILEAFQRLDG